MRDNRRDFDDPQDDKSGPLPPNMQIQEESYDLDDGYLKNRLRVGKIYTGNHDKVHPGTFTDGCEEH